MEDSGTLACAPFPLERLYRDQTRSGGLYDVSRLDRSLSAWLDGRMLVSELSSEPDRAFSDARGKMCGFAFQRGDLVYRCRACGRDPTCVFCAECWDEQAHQAHIDQVSYSITMSSGGCCDCGDTEAWRVPLSCKLHDFPRAEDLPKDGGAEEHDLQSDSVHALVDQLLMLPLISMRAHRFSLDPSGPFFNSSFPLLPGMVDDGSMSIFIYNDEHHSFDQVISILESAFGYPAETGKALAETIDRRGRACVHVSRSLGECTQLVSSISSSGLLIKMLPTFLAFIEDSCSVIAKWITGKCSASPWLQSSVSFYLSRPSGAASRASDASALLGHSVGFPLTPAHLFLLADFLLWKDMRCTVKELLMNTFLKTYRFKRVLGDIFTDCYPHIVAAFLEKDIEAEHSIVFFSVQLYTVPSLVKDLDRKKGLFLALLGVAMAAFSGPSSASSPPAVNLGSAFIQNRRYFHLFQDIRYVLDGSSIEHWPPESRAPLVLALFRFLFLFENMDPNRHVLAEHLEFESDDWMHAFNLSLQCAKIAREAVSYFLPAADWLFPFLDTQIIPRFFSPDRDGLAPVPPLGGSFSFHRPAHWLLCSLFRARPQGTIMSPDSVKTIASGPLRLFVCLGQFRGSLWTRNGFSFKNQVHNYLGVNFSDEVRDLDLYALQLFLEGSGEDAVETIIRVFNIGAYTGETAGSSGFAGGPEALAEAKFSMIEHLVALFVCLLNEETSEELSPESLLQRAISHFLFLGPVSNSELLKRLPGKFSEMSEYRSVLSSLSHASTKRKKESGAKTVYSYRPRGPICVFYPYYSYSDRQAALDRLKKEGFPSGDTDSFSRSRSLILEKSPSLLSLLRFVLEEAGSPLGGEKHYWSVVGVLTLCRWIPSLRDQLAPALGPLSALPPSLQELVSLFLGKKGPAKEPPALSSSSASERRRHVLAQMAAAQSAFSASSDSGSPASPPGPSGTLCKSFDRAIEVGPSRTEDLGACAVCHDTLDPSDAGRCIGFISRLSSERFFRFSDPASTRSSEPSRDTILLLHAESPAADQWTYSPNCDSPSCLPSIFLTTCPHLFHYDCFLAMAHPSGRRYSVSPAGPARCPLCRKRGNVFLPLVDPSRSSDVLAGRSEPPEYAVLFKTEPALPDAEKAALARMMPRLSSVVERWNWFQAASLDFPYLLGMEGGRIVRDFGIRICDYGAPLSPFQFEKTCQAIANMVSAEEILQRKRGGSLSYPHLDRLVHGLVFLSRVLLTGKKIKTHFRIGDLVFNYASLEDIFEQFVLEVVRGKQQASLCLLVQWSLVVFSPDCPSDVPLFDNTLSCFLGTLNSGDVFRRRALVFRAVFFSAVRDLGPFACGEGSLALSAENCRPDYPLPYTLVPLPAAFDDLLKKCLKRACAACGKVPADPALCLICGRLCCTQSLCCFSQSSQIGECNLHMKTRCGKSCGLFLLLHKAALLMLGETTAVLKPSPYIDRFGEPDMGFRRGDPLFLSEGLVSDLENMWLTHSLAETVESGDDAGSGVDGLLWMMI